jgi:hypothetical protein
MKKLILLLCIPFIGIAQTDYELAFNSATSDYVEIPNASSLIVNSTTFSMSAWVYPQANPAAHAGIMGFRNNIDSDFYLLQLQNSNNVEARFRNSSGISFDVLANNLLDFNQWQHLAFTYDGSNIFLYKNGVLVSSTPANGVITQMSQSFKVGALDWGTTGFYMNGSLDEIRLWNITLSQNAISNWMCNEITTLHPNYNNLAGYWRLNEGVGTTTADLSLNGNNGTLMGLVQWQVTTSCFGSPILTYVPSDNFENYLEANGMGDGIALNDSVLTANINTVTSLYVGALNIGDLTGIEDFTALTDLECDGNQLTSLDLSNNTALTDLDCEDNFLPSLDLSQNTALTNLECYDNFLISLDLSQNTALTFLECEYNQLKSLDLRNGNNINLSMFTTFNNPTLTCINVDDSTWSANNWTFANGNIDTQHYFSTNCFAVAFDCTDSLEVTDVIIDNTNLTMNIAIYNGYNYFLNYPYVAFTIDANGDTVQGGGISLFGANSLDTTWYNYSLSNVISPAYPLTMYFVYSDGSLVTDTCILTYNSTPSAIIDINLSSNRKLISIVDVLGRENKGTKNKPLFYIYNDGTVEKQIIIE